MMHMTFYWGKEVTILFSSWRTDTWLSYALSLLACLLAAVFYQYLEDRRIKLRRLAAERIQATRPADPQIQAALLEKAAATAGGSAVKIVQAVLFAVSSGLGYMLMLAIMSFNGGVFIAVVLGLTIGYLAFRSTDDEAAVLDSPCACA